MTPNLCCPLSHTPPIYSILHTHTKCTYIYNMCIHLYVCAYIHFQSCPTLCNPMDCSLPGSCVHGIFQAIVLEWIAMSFSRESSQPRDQTCVFCISCIGRWILYHWATWKTHICVCVYMQFNNKESLEKFTCYNDFLWGCLCVSFWLWCSH